MTEHATAGNLIEAVLLDGGRDLDQFYCVDIPVRDKLIYQFKIWQTDSMFMSILVKEDSKFLSFIEINSKFSMKFYSEDYFYPYQELVTEIRDISLQECERLRGHYLVSLEIIEEAEDQKIDTLIYSGEYNMYSDMKQPSKF
ncbi:MAG: hypothetical protein JXL81_10105 [Deltaproteobacteria bacterium]|nr:hypothetical protein [Deltaproteobacteria bacterium]